MEHMRWCRVCVCCFHILVPLTFPFAPLFAMCAMYYDRSNHPYIKWIFLMFCINFCLLCYCACAPNILRFLCIHRVCFVYKENYPDKNTRVFRLFSFGVFMAFCCCCVSFHIFFSMLNFSLCLTLNCTYAQGKPTFDLVNMGTKIENMMHHSLDLSLEHCLFLSLFKIENYFRNFL